MHITKVCCKEPLQGINRTMRGQSQESPKEVEPGTFQRSHQQLFRELHGSDPSTEKGWRMWDAELSRPEV